MADTLEAHFQHRIYFFTIVNKNKNDFSISMYSTPYHFVKVPKPGGPETELVWRNHANNKMDMVAGLIEAVVEVVYAQP